MTYTTADDLAAFYGDTVYLQLADRDGDGVADADLVARVLEAADAEIDGWIGGRYAVPLDNASGGPPNRVKTAARIIAWFYLHTQGLLADAPDAIAYRDQIKWLQAIANGDASLPPGTREATALPAAGSGGAVFVAPRRLLSRDSLREF